jgi:hypothetical protein
MDESNVWSMDRLAAANLLADLRLEPNDANLERVERHFAQHRLTAMEWAAKRAQSSIIARVEAASARYFPHHGEEWAAGFCCAEQQIATVGSVEMLQIDTGKAASKGQILRRMVRQAREGS